MKERRRCLRQRVTFGERCPGKRLKNGVKRLNAGSAGEVHETEMIRV